MKPVYTSKWSAPSNIAVIKYWGKKKTQKPISPSLSFTLSKCISTTEIKIFEKVPDNNFSFEFLFQNKKPSQKFTDKMNLFLLRADSQLKSLKKYNLIINSSNNFPHSAGLASSASSFASISLCLLDICYYLEKKERDLFFLEQASSIARLGSGSACRSIYPLASWGNISNEHSTPITDTHPLFNDLCCISLIIDSSEKKLSSTEGHERMNNHPLKKERVLQANTNFKNMLEALKNGDFDSFIAITEEESKTLHHLIETSKPSIKLITSNSEIVLKNLKIFRNTNKIKFALTLDAGPNIHIICLKKDINNIKSHLLQHIIKYLKDGRFIENSTNARPKKISNEN